MQELGFNRLDITSRGLNESKKDGDSERTRHLGILKRGFVNVFRK